MNPELLIFEILNGQDLSAIMILMFIIGIVMVKQVLSVKEPQPRIAMWCDRPWWTRKSLHPWFFWDDPHSYVRVCDPRFGPLYYYENVHPLHIAQLMKDDWTFVGRSGELLCFSCRDKEKAIATFKALGLPVPDASGWSDKTRHDHVHKVYWHEPMYYI